MKLKNYISYGLFVVSILFATETMGQRGDRDIPLKDQQITDDLIVQGSTCIGFDCVNGENFGFATLKLKENNLRILFDDTSNSASFPANDWQLTANGTSNGGDNKFSIDDITSGRTPFTIKAGAPNHALFVDGSGRIGMGTSTPVVEAHVKDGDSPTLRLEQDGSSGFSQQTWDIAGNEANFFIRDVTNGSELPFKIKPGADENALFIAADNNIGLSTQNPEAKLHLFGAGATTLFTRYEAGGITAPGGREWDLGINNNGVFSLLDVDYSRTVLRIFPDNGNNSLVLRNGNVGIGTGNPNTQRLQVQGDILANGNVINSDARLKRNVTDLERAMELLSKLQPKRYFFRTDEFAEFELPEEEQFGLLAQEVEAVLPNLVHDGLVAADDNGNVETTYKALNYTALVPILVQGAKEQQAEIEELKKENAEIRAELEDLKKLVYQLAGKEDGTLNSQTATLEAATLAQNQPNPFSENTTIRYNIPQDTQQAELRITNRAGKLVKAIAIAAKGPGQTVLEAGSLHAGQYFYTLVLDGKVSKTKQMILTK